MSSKDITQTCTSCGGEGTTGGPMIGPDGIPVPSDELCPKCNGAKVIYHGELSDDLIDLWNDILDKVNDIKQKVDEL
jgi:hypothetical protein